MYLIFFWVKREKTKQKNPQTSVLGEGHGREEADTYQSHDAQPVYFPRRAVRHPPGCGSPAAGRGGAGERGGGKRGDGAH